MLDRESQDNTPQQSSAVQLLRSWGPLVIGITAIAVVLRLLVIQAYYIPSESMLPTLDIDDRVIVNQLSYSLGEIERGQVAVFDRPAGVLGQDDFIKRIIGLPGETIRFIDREVYVDGLRVVEPYLLEQASTRPQLPIPGCEQAQSVSDMCVIPDGHVFMLGDNRIGSEDSRVFGPISVDNIVGRAFVRMWPLHKPALI